ncbi:MAG: excinuclease ABC subunit UvrA [Saprospiraceae bacterium]|nr:excinuclease ABC subunit UvrA [Saprospiraceae bacterium]
MKSIYIKNARVNNLKNVSVEINRNKLVVVTGVSGSGKSSLAFDTLYAEGQRRYVESLSSYARQFMERMEKPEVDYIQGIAPAMAIQQKVSTSNPRSTVGTVTEVYDYLKLLFARAGKTYSPVSGKLVTSDDVTHVVDEILSNGPDTKVVIYARVPVRSKGLKTELALSLQKGFTRFLLNGQVSDIEEVLESPDLPESETLTLLIDRTVVKDPSDEETRTRLADSVQTAYQEGHGVCIIQVNGGALREYSERFEADGIEFERPSVNFFSFNNPYGACPTCEGYGRILGIDPDKVVPNPTLSVYDGAIAPWKGEKFGEYLEQLLRMAHHFDFPVHTPFEQLTREEKKLLWTGNAWFEGINAFFQELESKTYKIQNRVVLARYRGRTTCTTCEGGRLRSEALCVRIGGMNIADLISLPLDELLGFFQNLSIGDHDRQVAKRLLLEIENRLGFMVRLGLGYLTLDRISSTLSGGETQRIHLTRTLGSNLTASMYLLDEPSVGLHPRDTRRLVEVLKSLRDLGNTVVVVEHEEEVIRSADYLVDMGPEAGLHGGHVVFAGNYADLQTQAPHSLTAEYLSGAKQIQAPAQRRKAQQFIVVRGARQHNLKNIDVRIPLHSLTVISGVSGSGKSTLVRDILHPALTQHLPDGAGKAPGLFDGLEGQYKRITAVEFINQSPIGKSSRSNPVTYVKAYDYIRDLFADQQLSKIRGFQPKHFSFNVDGGRCDTCKGEGEQVIEMQFLADVHLECEACKGRRFKHEVLEVEYKGKSIFDVLDMSVEESLAFFKGKKDILNRLQPLFDVGLGYVKLGQSSSTLSGGEAQRVKLASFLIRDSHQGHIFFIFDEPTTGLHFHDVRKLLDAMQALVEKGHTVLVVEHNLDVINSADWVVDLGPEGGKMGGHLVYEGPPEGLVAVAESFTGQFLERKTAG